MITINHTHSIHDTELLASWHSWHQAQLTLLPRFGIVNQEKPPKHHNKHVEGSQPASCKSLS